MSQNSDVPDEPPSLPEREDGREVAGRPPLVGPILYPNCYIWYVLLAALDLMLTWVFLSSGGSELNALADAVICRWGHTGLVIFKFSLVVLVVGICQVVGRRDHQTGRRLAEWAVAITAIPVVASFVQLLFRT